MKILIVASTFFPEVSPRSFRTTELAKEFSRQGHDVKIITYKNIEQQELVNKYGFTIKDLGQIKFKPIRVRGTGVINLFFRFWARILNWLFEYPDIDLIRLVRKSLKGESGYDLLVSIAVPYPIHWGVASMRSKQNIIAPVWIADCGDPYMGQENDSFSHPFYFAWLEKHFCKKANYIAVPTNGSITAYYPEFHSKIRVIPQGFDFDEVETYKGELQKGKVIFGYGGMFIPGRRDPREFLDYLTTLNELAFEFHIYTATPGLVEPYLEKLPNKLFVHGPINRNKLLFELSKMNFVINFENAGNKQTPSKLIDYCIIDKPILSVKTGGLDTKVLDEFLAGEYSHAMKIENVDQYKISNVAKLFLSLVK